MLYRVAQPKRYYRKRLRPGASERQRTSWNWRRKKKLKLPVKKFDLQLEKLIKSKTPKRVSSKKRRFCNRCKIKSRANNIIEEHRVCTSCRDKCLEEANRNNNTNFKWNIVDVKEQWK